MKILWEHKNDVLFVCLYEENKMIWLMRIAWPCFWCDVWRTHEEKEVVVHSLQSGGVWCYGGGRVRLVVHGRGYRGSYCYTRGRKGLNECVEEIERRGKCDMANLRLRHLGAFQIVSRVPLLLEC